MSAAYDLDGLDRPKALRPSRSVRRDVDDLLFAAELRRKYGLKEPRPRLVNTWPTPPLEPRPITPLPPPRSRAQVVAEMSTASVDELVDLVVEYVRARRAEEESQ